MAKLKTRAGIANLETEDGTACTDKEKAEALNKFFFSVFTKENTDFVPEPKTKPIKVPIQDLVITEEGVLKKLNSLNPAKSPGPDMMHPRLLKELGPAISNPLKTIMMKSLTESVLPKKLENGECFTDIQERP